MARRQQHPPPETCAASTPCGTCPWRAQNQTADAVKHSPADYRGVKWFDVDNLRTRWDHVREGGMMPCHATDPRAHLYGGKKAPEQAPPRICVGLTIMAKRETHAFLASGGNFKRYQRRSGKRFTLAGLAQWAARLVYTGATFEVMSIDDGPRTFIMPDVVDSPDVRLPWNDSVQKGPPF